MELRCTSFKNHFLFEVALEAKTSQPRKEDREDEPGNQRVPWGRSHAALLWGLVLLWRSNSPA